MRPPMDPGDYLISFGRKYKGRKLKEIPKFEIESYLEWLEKNVIAGKTAMSQQAIYLRNAFDRLYYRDGSSH